MKLIYIRDQLRAALRSLAKRGAARSQYNKNFALEREANSELLIRAKHNRRINHELKLLKEAIDQTTSSGQLDISVPRKDDRPSRSATLTIRCASFTFPAPSNRPKTAAREQITLNVISAREDNPPTGETPINWLLLTINAIRYTRQLLSSIKLHKIFTS